jgi:hypothetical protein
VVVVGLVAWLAFRFPWSAFVASDENVDRDGLHQATSVKIYFRASLKVDNQVVASLEVQISTGQEKVA